MATKDTRFFSRWRGFNDFEFVEEPDICPYAQAFLEWAPQALSLGEDPDIVSINQRKIRLVDKYFDWFSAVPKRHRYHVNPSGHTCIYQVFQQLYYQLRAIELDISPPIIYIPPSPPPPPPPIQFAGIVMPEEE